MPNESLNMKDTKIKYLKAGNKWVINDYIKN